MRKIAIAFVALIVALGAMLYGMSQPAVMEKVVEWTCNTVTERCLVRMRALGHAWSRYENFERATHWYRRGADAGDPPAMFHLGWALERSGMVETIQTVVESKGTAITLSAKIDEAATWYRRAADASFAPAMNNLGNLLEQVLIGHRDLDAVFRLYMAAAQMGNPVAAFNVSRAYRHGLGTDRDPSEADKWAKWSPTRFDQADLAEPTLERTYFGGSDLPLSTRANLRGVAEDGPPAFVRLKLGPLKADPRIPTFSQVRGRLSEERR